MKNNNFLLAASLISSNLLNLELTLEELNKGKIDLIHFDVMDGSFVPRFGLPLELIRIVKETTAIPVNVHIMANNIEPYIKNVAEFGADSFTFDNDATNNAIRIVDLIHANGMNAGIALNPATPLTALDHTLEKIDSVTLMAIRPGIPGHPFIPSTHDKLKELKNKISSRNNVKIEIDGGINEKTAVRTINAGADILVCGSHSIFNGNGILSQNIVTFRNNISKQL